MLAADEVARAGPELAPLAPAVLYALRPLETATFHGAGRHDAVIVYSPVAAIRALSALAWYREYVDAHRG